MMNPSKLKPAYFHIRLGALFVWALLAFVSPVWAITPASPLAACPGDTLPPTISNCPGDTVIPFDNTMCGAVFTWPDIVATDDCDSNLIISSNYASGDTFRLNTTVVTIQAIDSSGNVGSCSFTITLANPGFGLANCPQPVIVAADDSCMATATWDSPMIIDLCNSNPQLDSSHAKGSSFLIDTTWVTYTLSNALGNQFSCSFPVIVLDSMPPVVTGCPADTVIAASASCTATFAWDIAAIAATDNCSSTTLLPPSHPVGFDFPLGMTTVKHEAIDEAGNTGSCTFNVTVVDTLPPVVSNCPGDFSITVFSGCDTIANWIEPAFSDACDATLEVSKNFSPGGTFNTGIYNVTYTAKDDSGNTSHCTFSLTVKDATPPTLTGCPNDTTIIAGANCQAEFNYKLPTITDDCSTGIEPLVIPNTNTFPIGSTNVQIFAKDAGGNESSCSFLVVVKDETPPVTICPQGITVKSDGTILNDADNIIASITGLACDQVKIDFDLPEITDNCQVSLVDSTVLSQSFAAGTTPVTYSYTDGFGNAGACTFTVTVESVANDTIEITATANPVCPGGEVVLTTSITDPNATFQWAGPGFAGSNATVVIPDFSAINEGTYQVTVTTGGCVLQSGQGLTLSLAQPPSALADTYSTPVNTPATIDVLLNDQTHNQAVIVAIDVPPSQGIASVNADQQIEYTPNTGYTGADQLIYKVCVENCPALCATALVNMDVNTSAGGDTCIIPNLITPNSDGLNDFLFLDCLDISENNSRILIYNQWGSLIYKAEPYQNNWNGTVNGDVARPVPDGTYYYIFWKDTSQEPVKGFITVFR